MNGYQYLIARNRLMQKLEDDLERLGPMPNAERAAETRRLETEFDAKLAELYAQVAEEYPGERKKKARPIADPR
ncbi:MAG: hypothetical protein ACREQI_03175 [Candidatus Binataceae bacterium]